VSLSHGTTSSILTEVDTTAGTYIVFGKPSFVEASAMVLEERADGRKLLCGAGSSNCEQPLP